MNGRQFQWHPEKAEANRRKHGVPFEEAASVFDDPNAKPEYDALHSGDEDRWLLIGFSSRLRLLTVAYTKHYETIRLISARRATKAERRRYAQAN